MANSIRRSGPARSDAYPVGEWTETGEGGQPFRPMDTALISVIYVISVSCGRRTEYLIIEPRLNGSVMAAVEHDIRSGNW
jgi:hypothetical protein